MGHIAMFDPSANLPDETPVEKVTLPTRISNALSIAGIQTVGEIREASDQTLSPLSGLV